MREKTGVFYIMCIRSQAGKRNAAMPRKQSLPLEGKVPNEVRRMRRSAGAKPAHLRENSRRKIAILLDGANAVW